MDAEVEKLIELVKENPVLYVTSHPDYMKTKLKDELWEKIGIEFDTDGKAVKEKWLKLRECHREALRRQRKRKREDAVEHPKPWTYQYQMEFLIPFMKNRLTNTSLQDSMQTNTPPIIDDAEDVENTARDESLPSLSNETNEFVKNEIPSKNLNSQGGQLLQEFIEASERLAKSHDKFRQRIFEKLLSSHPNQNDALLLFFLSMYSTTTDLSAKYQRQVRNKVYEAVTQAEEQHAFEISNECSSCSSSNTHAHIATSPTTFQHNMTQQFSEFIQPQPTVQPSSAENSNDTMF